MSQKRNKAARRRRAETLPSQTGAGGWIGLAAAILSAARPSDLQANPEGMTVVRGTASAQADGKQLNITTGDHTFLDWRSFNIRPGETTRFLQPSSDSIVLNRIQEGAPSAIWGTLSANGTVILANAHGFYFGPNSLIQVGGSFIATTAPINPDMTAAAPWQFSGLPPTADIVNYGAIDVGAGRSLFLIAERVENHGSLDAPGGSICLAAGSEVLINDRPDGRGLAASVKLPEGSIDNLGRVTADGGTIALHARVVNQDGILQAAGVRERGGVVELVAAEELSLGEHSRILTPGFDGPGGGVGGSIALKAGGTFQDAVGSVVNARGGAAGGEGGTIEISAPNLLSLDSQLGAAAAPGSKAGRLLLDPTDILLGTSGDGSAAGGSVLSGLGAGTLRLDVNRAFKNLQFSGITLQATHDITLVQGATSQGTTWDLGASTGQAEGLLTLQAGNNITFEGSSRILDAGRWSVRLDAGVDFSSGSVRAGTGSIYLGGGRDSAGKPLKGGGAIELAAGSISLTAGLDLLVGTGYVRTMAGGSIHAHALQGDLDAGKRNDSFDYLLTGIRVASTGPGGISTAGGGDVILEAGHDVVSVPDVGPGQTPGGSGALGSQAGDVTVNAGHGIFGNFILQHGTGRLLAGVELGLDGSPTVTHPDATIGIATKAVSLSLASGSWSAYAARDIFIGEVRNPSGTFNSRRVPVPEGVFIGNSGVGGDILPPVRASFLFDYSPDAAARLWAGNGIHLLGANLPRVTGQNQGMPAIYPPTLSLEAGAGGIEIQNSLVLYPSQEGSLQITTHAGGGIHGGQQSGTLIGIVMSDSGLPDWNTFISGHAITPLHLNDPDPVKMEISGKVDSFGLAVPTVAQVHVHGDAYNFRFQGQNLSASAVTDLVVDGAIRYRGGLTSVTLDDLLPAVVYSPALSADPGIARKLRYDPATGKLSFYGQMTEGERTALLNPRALLFDSHGAPLDADHQVIDRPGVEQGWVYVPLTDGQKAAIRKLYTDSQDAALADQGLSVAGPGLFHVQAQKVDLGISSGISVRGPNFNPALEGISPLGANLSIDIAESLVMTTTKIANEGYRGGISLRVGESIDVGDQLSSFGSPADPKGIFTTSGGSLQVTAGRDINVNGSRIATYNGGTLTVRSEHGDVNAGVGGSGSVSFRTTDLDPATGKLVGIPSTIPGSGILATTVPGSFPDSVVGNITVQAPEGNINASLGGIIQLSFNGSDSRRSGIALTAGKDINAGGSGVIGNNISLDAGGNINGLVIGSGNIALRSEHNINVTAIGSGGVSVSAGGSVSGTIVSGGSVNVSGDSISAALVSKNVSASGDTSKAAVGVPTSNVAKSDTKVAEDAATLGGRTPEKSLKDQDESRSRPKPAPVVRKVSRVTVILPTNP